MKHVALDYHFICEQVQSGALRIAHVSSEDQLADAFTKPLLHALFLILKPRLGSPLGTPSSGSIMKESLAIIIF